MIFFVKHASFKEVDKTKLENKFLWWHNKCNDDDCRRVTDVVVLMLNNNFENIFWLNHFNLCLLAHVLVCSSCCCWSCWGLNILSCSELVLNESQSFNVLLCLCRSCNVNLNLVYATEVTVLKQLFCLFYCVANDFNHYCQLTW